jgi:excisionase family DNA binding protein
MESEVIVMNLFTVKEVAKMLRLTEKTVYKMIKTGAIPSVKIGGALRITQEAVDQILERGA